jgi:hypothetical protein
LTTPVAAAHRPGLLVVEDLDRGGFGVRDDDGDHHWLAASPQALASLQKGDIVLGALVRDGAPRRLGGLVVVLPDGAQALME